MNQRSADRSRLYAAKNRSTMSPQKRVGNSSKDRYLVMGSPTRMTQEQKFHEAKRILDTHINYLSKGCYYFFRDGLGKFDETAMQLLRAYNNHENSEQLVHSLMDHYDSQEVSYSKKNARSAKVIANDWL